MSVHARGQRLDVGRVVDDAEAVAQPLHGRAGHEDRSLERVGDGAAGELPADGGEQTVDGLGRLGAHVHQHERAGAVGVLGHARLEAGLAEQRRLLVAGDAAHGDAVGCRAEAAARRSHLGQARHRHAEEVAQLGGPRARRMS